MMNNKNECVLLYLKENGEREKKIKLLLAQKGVRIISVMQQQQLQTIEKLFLNQPSEQPSEVTATQMEMIPFHEDIMILKGFTRERMNELLDGFRRNKISKIQLKAVVTEHNIQWTLKELYLELRKEHEELSKYNNA